MKYFLHDTNAFSDEKVTMLYIKFGYEAVGLFFVILEKLAMQEKPVKEDVLKTQLNIKKRLQKHLDFMYEIDILSVRNGEVFNENLASYSEKYKIKKEKTRKRVSEWRENKAVEKNVTEYKHVRNTSKVKESKVKEKEYKKEQKVFPENIIFVFDSIKKFFSKDSYTDSEYRKSLETIDKLIRIDKISEEMIIEVISLKENCFYGKNVQSIQTLRIKNGGLTKFEKLKNYLEAEIKEQEKKQQYEANRKRSAGRREATTKEQLKETLQRSFEKRGLVKGVDF